VIVSKASYQRLLGEVFQLKDQLAAKEVAVKAKKVVAKAEKIETKTEEVPQLDPSSFGIQASTIAAIQKK
jgi:hypothetical protein